MDKYAQSLLPIDGFFVISQNANANEKGEEKQNRRWQNNMITNENVMKTFYWCLIYSHSMDFDLIWSPNYK